MNFFQKPACLQEFFLGHIVNRLVVRLTQFIQPLLQKHVVGKNTPRDILQVNYVINMRDLEKWLRYWLHILGSTACRVFF